MEHSSASESVLRLLSNSMLPDSAQLPILYQAVPLLERQELPLLFSSNDTSILLAHLQVPSLTQWVLLALLQGRQCPNVSPSASFGRGPKMCAVQCAAACGSDWADMQVSLG